MSIKCRHPDETTHNVAIRRDTVFCVFCERIFDQETEVTIAQVLAAEFDGVDVAYDAPPWDSILMPHVDDPSRPHDRQKPRDGPTVAPPQMWSTSQHQILAGVCIFLFPCSSMSERRRELLRPGIGGKGGSTTIDPGIATHCVVGAEWPPPRTELHHLLPAGCKIVRESFLTVGEQESSSSNAPHRASSAEKKA